MDVRALSDVDWYGDRQRDVVAATYDEGYGPDADRTVTHRRTVIFIKTGALGPYLLVIDRLLPQDAALHTYQVLWHLDTDAADIDGLVVRSTDAGRPNLAIVPATQPGLAVTLVQGQETPEWQGWKAVRHHQQGDYAPAPTAVYMWQARGPSRLVTLLFPLLPDTICPICAVDAAADPAETAIGLHLTNWATLTLDESPSG
jgi:hypothetical protein